MITSQTIKKQFDDYYGFDISIKSRKQQYSFARMLYCTMCRELTSESYSVIGKYINRDHATALYSSNQFENVFAYNPIYKKDYTAIKNKVLSNKFSDPELRYKQAINLAMYYRKKYQKATSNYDMKVTKKELDSLIKAEVKRQTSTLKNEKPIEFLTREEVCDMLKINFTSVKNWSKKGLLKPITIQRKVYFKRNDIEEMLLKNYQIF